MSSIAIVIRTELLNAFQSKRKRISRSSLFSLVYKIVATVILIVISNRLLFFFELLTSIGIDNSFVYFISTVMFVLSLISATLGLYKTLFASGQGGTLLFSLPITSLKLFIAKLLTFLIYELIANIIFYFGLMIGIGILLRLSISYYFLLIISYFLINLLAVFLGSLFATTISLIRNAISKFRFIKVLFGVALIFSIYLIVFSLLKLLPTSDLRLLLIYKLIYRSIMAFISSFSFNNPISPFIHFVFGRAVFSSIFQSIIIILVLAILSFIIVRPLFLKLVYQSDERTLSKTLEHRVKFHSKHFYLNYLKKELLEIVAKPILFFTDNIFFFFSPLIIISFNAIIKAMPLVTLGRDLLLIANFIIISLLYLSLNISNSDQIKKDINSILFMKTLPTNIYGYIFAKLTINIVMLVTGLSVSIVVLQLFSNVAISNSIMLFLSILFIVIGHLIFTFTRLFRAINIENLGGFDKVAKNSIAVSLLLSISYALLYYLNLGDKTSYFALYRTALAALIFLLIMIYLGKRTIDAYYKNFGLGEISS